VSDVGLQEPVLSLPDAKVKEQSGTVVDPCVADRSTGPVAAISRPRSDDTFTVNVPLISLPSIRLLGELVIAVLLPLTCAADGVAKATNESADKTAAPRTLSVLIFMTRKSLR
jgi:hypothetical protein